MRTIFGFLLVMIFTGASAQKEVLDKISKVMTLNLKEFIPKEYDTLETAKGDLNKDGFADVVMVLKSRLEEKDITEIDPDSIPPRILMVLSKSGNKPGYDAYFVSLITNKAILCRNCGGVFGDPFQGVAIKNGVITINHYGGSAWRWGKTDKFRFKEGRYLRIGALRYSYWNVEHCPKWKEFAGLEKEDINFLTGQFEEKKISTECKLVYSKRGKQKVLPLTDLQDFEIEN